MQASVFKALADDTRLAIAQHLAKEGCCTCICELAPVVDKDQSTVYRHVKALEEAGLVRTRKHGRKLLCCATEKTKTLLEHA